MATNQTYRQQLNTSVGPLEHTFYDSLDDPVVDSLEFTDWSTDFNNVSTSWITSIEPDGSDAFTFDAGPVGDLLQSSFGVSNFFDSEAPF